MKKLFTLFSVLFILKASFATTHLINVSDFQFSPASTNAVVGDTIKWVWVNGFHTTSSVSVPSGAASWDSALIKAGAVFAYKLTVAGTYNFQCNVHPLQMQGTITVSGTLPVVLNKFNVVPGKLNAALLTWSTTSEQNTDRFEVMRSSNGNNFNKVGAITAKGNSSVLVNYSYIDNIQQISSRYIYYYLAVIDKDGKRSISNIIKFRNENGTSKLITSLSPNPVGRSGHIMLQFNADKTDVMHAQLFDAAGKLVMKEELSAVAGLNNGHFHIGGIAPGNYALVFTMGSKKESYKIIVE